ncbi:MAG: efflux RND transporter periplasmic adaptor subunit [Puniceicoccales bacterium]|jgi:multidrug efflux system membrane fusion protein|nr:efflux RND transporter periplasmic adaptor subunit [Puniceicoccales bacterium]
MKLQYILLGMAVLAGGAGCQRALEQRERIVPVRVATATRRDVPVYVDSLGVCTAYETVNVISQVSGKIAAMHFYPGHRVERGQLLYSIDSRPYEAEVTRARGQLQAAQAKLEIDRLQLERSEELQRNQYISQQNFDNLAAMVLQDEGQVKVAMGNLQQAEVNLDFCRVQSPVSGIAGSDQINVGNVLSTMNPVTLVRIQTMDPLYVDFTISENEFPEVYARYKERGSLDCEISLVSDANVQAKARLEIIDNQISPRSGNVKLRALLANGHGVFWPGESVRVRLILTTAKGAILAPEVAVNVGQSGRHVFAVENGYAEMRPVKVGQMHGSDVVFQDGVKDGDRLVIAGQFLLMPHTRVIVGLDEAAGPSQGPNAPADQSGQSQNKH